VANFTLPLQIKPSEPDKIHWRNMLGVNTQVTTQHRQPATGQTDWRGIQQLQLKTRLIADIELPKQWKASIGVNGFVDAAYRLNGRDSYNSGVLAAQETELELFEAYVMGSLLPQTDLKIGRQIIVWGKSDTIRITDIINPLDNRQPGLVDIEDLRLPVFSTKLTQYHGDWAMSLIALHEQRPPKEPATNGEYLPIAIFPFPPGFQFPEVDQQQSEFDTTFALSAEGRFSGWDVSLYAARAQDNRWTFNANKTERSYQPMNMFGAAANFSLGGGLLKTEIGYFSDLKYNTTQKSKNRLDVLIGYDYLSIPDWSFSFEIANRIIQDYETSMAQMPDAVSEQNWQSATRVSYDFNRDKAKLSYLISAFGEQAELGGFQRLWLDYDYTDQVNASIGYIDYFGGEHLLWDALKNNDRLFASLEYYF
jgi:hypothetical protein